MGGGACKLDPASGKIGVYSEKNGLANNNVMSIASDKEGNLWFATLGGGVSRMSSSGEIRNFSSADGLGSDYVYFVFNDSKNNMWFASDVLTKFDGKKFNLFFNSPEMEGKTIFSIDEDKLGNIWLSSSESGIFKFDGVTFQNYSSANGLRDDSPSILACDENDNIILAHKSGIDKFNPAANSFNYFGIEEGLASFEPNLNAVFKQAGGNIWIGTTAGAIKYNTSGELNNLVEPLTQITRFRVLTDEVEMQAEAAFEHHRNNVTFDFIGLSLTNPQKVRYRVMLENFDAGWLPETQLTSKNYPYLPPGEYKFLVKSCNNEGVWNQDPVSLEFKILPPFWQTWWFWTFLITAIFGSAYIYIKWKVKKIESEKKILEQKVQDRTSEILTQKKIIEEKNKSITDSINYAERIQRAILAKEEDIKKYFPESFLLYKPKDIVAGDFYFFETTDTHVFYAAADCTGHGVPGAMVSVVCSNALTRCVREFQLTDPGEILDKTRELVLETFKKSGEGIKDGMDISLLSLEFRENVSEKPEPDNQKKVAGIHWAGANNPLWYIHQGGLIEIPATKQPIGYIENPKPFVSHKIELEGMENPLPLILFLFTDGYADQFGGPREKKFRYKQLENLLLSINKKPAGEQKEILDDTIEKWKGDLEQVDDICVIGVRV